MHTQTHKITHSHKSTHSHKRTHKRVKAYTHAKARTHKSTHKHTKTYTPAHSLTYSLLSCPPSSLFPPSVPPSIPHTLLPLSLPLPRSRLSPDTPLVPSADTHEIQLGFTACQTPNLESLILTCRGTQGVGWTHCNVVDVFIMSTLVAYGGWALRGRGRVSASANARQVPSLQSLAVW